MKTFLDSIKRLDLSQSGVAKTIVHKVERGSVNLVSSSIRLVGSEFVLILFGKLSPVRDKNTTLQVVIFHSVRI